MLDWLQNIDRAITLCVNGWQTPFWDSVMIFLSGKWSFVPLYIAVVLCIILKKRSNCKSGWKVALAMIAAIVLTFAATDQIAHNIIKPLVGRLRPGYDPYIWYLITTPDGRGGLFTFVSNHAANFMGFAAISTLLLKNKILSVIVFAVAAAVCFSRIYLARHFFSDVICGAIVGFVVAVIIYWLYKKLAVNYLYK